MSRANDGGVSEVVVGDSVRERARPWNEIRSRRNGRRFPRAGPLYLAERATTFMRNIVRSAGMCTDGRTDERRRQQSVAANDARKEADRQTDRRTNSVDYRMAAATNTQLLHVARRGRKKAPSRVSC
jgi:hypothetical protein